MDAWFAREVAVEYKDFVDEILDESPEALQMTTDTSLADGQVQSTPNRRTLF